MAYDPALILPLRLLENISKGYLRKNLRLPVAGDKNEAVIPIDDPSNHQRIMEIQGVLNARNYVFRVGLPEHISLFLRDAPLLNHQPASKIFSLSSPLRAKRRSPNASMTKTMAVKHRG